MKATLISLLMLSLFGLPSNAAESPTSAFGDARLPPVQSGPDRYQALSIASKHLKNTRELRILEPLPAQRSGVKPVNLYLLDADWLFPMLAAHLDYLSYFNQLPPIRIIGLLNHNRNQDFITPVDSRFPKTGEGDKFQAFIDQELRPKMAQLYPESQVSILLGHSFGGVASMTHLLGAEEPFDAYIAVGTSVWIAQDWLLEIAKTQLPSMRPDQRVFVHLSAAQFDGGETLPKSVVLAQLFEKLAPSAVEFHFAEIERTNHFTSVLPAVLQAFEQLFPAWPLAQKIADLETSSPQAIAEIFDATQAALGYRFWPLTEHLSVVAYQWAARGHAAQSEQLVTLLTDFFDRDPETHAIASYVASLNGQSSLALSRIERAIQLGEGQQYNSNRVAMYRNVKGRLETHLSNNQKQ